MFHPIAYQFYFFTVAGLAVALKNACRAETVHARTAPAPRHDVADVYAGGVPGLPAGFSPRPS